MHIHRIREMLHARILKLRSLEGVLSSLRFERLWSDSTNQQREEVTGYIKDEKRDKVLAWIKDHPSLIIEEYPVAQLKKLAQRMSIPNWSRMLKTELIIAIRSMEDGTK